ncbi:arginine/serine-rich coiled-coil protein 2 isoform X2 [Anthonomus grandis grandis]|nr:arginine/serine-rich coiled-coil protein 2 isoform X2 [Anthonomus grandis grandis]
MPGRPNLSANKQHGKPAVHGDNYEEVGMDMSEDSNDSEEPSSKLNNTSRDANPFYNNPDVRPEHTRRSDSPKHKREEERRSVRNEEERSRDDKGRDSDRDKYRPSRRDDDKGRGRRDDDKGKSKYRDDRRDRKDDRFGRDRRDRRRSRSRERKRDSRSPRRTSRSPKRSSRSPRRLSRSPRRSSRSPRRSSRSPRRSRSGSKDRGGDRKFSSRKEKADKRMDRLDKLGIQFKPDNYPKSALEDAERNSQPGGNRFFMPGITGRFRDQIEKRKLLWQKAKESDNAPAAGPSAPAPNAIAGGSKATKVYEATTFADDKTSNKFKRLMGIKETDPSALPVKGTDVLKKQQEMFTSMEAQYEVARTATHTMRGVGLGFGSFQR